MRMLRYFVLFLVALSALPQSHAVDTKPTSINTDWRIPPNAAVNVNIDWLLVQHPGDSQGEGHVNLEGALGEHHSYEIAWAYYTKLLGLDPSYPPNENPRVREDQKANRYFVKESLNDKGRFAIMGGRVGGYKLTMYLWTDDANRSRKDRVYVKMLFCP